MNGSDARPSRSSRPGGRIGRWIEAASAAGFVLLLVVACVALGLAIAWPLWAFATGARQAYTATVLGAAAAGIVFLLVRAARRRRSAMRDPSVPRRSVAAGLLAALMVLVGLCGAWLAAALLARGIWALGAAAVVAWILLLWVLGRARRAAKGRKPRAVPAENWSE